MTLHTDEVPAHTGTVRALLTEQCPRWAGLPLDPAGAGTDNTMYRLGDDLLVRLPRTAEKARALAKEQRWLPRLTPLLPVRIPQPVYAGRPATAFPLSWAVYRWIDGDQAGPATVRDWARFGTDLAAVVRRLHGLDLMGASRAGELSGYRGGSLRPCDEWITGALADCRARTDLDVDTLTAWWRAGVALPDPAGAQVWMHGDLKPSNLLVRDGRLHAVIDFGGLAVGFPDAEHAAVWDLPPAARAAYRTALALDDATWQRARAWAIAVGASGVAYYWDTYPAFVDECLTRLRAVLTDG